MKELLLGCGRNKEKLFSATDSSLEWKNRVTIDFNPDVEPDIVWDLNVLPYKFFQDNEFTEIHAYEVLEHLGSQGDFKSFFALFTELHRILAPNGLLYITTPSLNSRWLWGDPGHTRVITKESIGFLSQEHYKHTEDSPMSDYRFWYKADFHPVHIEEKKERNLFVLQCIKPSRYKKV